MFRCFGFACSKGLCILLCVFIDYDYEYYGYGDYRGGYNEPYFRYDELYYDYATPTQASAARQGRNRAQPVGHPKF